MRYGQQGGIPMEEMPAYIQDVLDLIEYANGVHAAPCGAGSVLRQAIPSLSI